MLSALAVTALLSLSDPPGDAVGNGTLTAPTATLFRERDTFDLRRVTVPEGDSLVLEVELGRFSTSFPQALVELYLSDTDPAATASAGSQNLLPGSGLRLPLGQSWRYAVRIVGDEVRLFSGENGSARDITGRAGLRVSVSGNTLRVYTTLPRLERFSLYGVSGSYDPFSTDGWRQLRETPSPWGFSGAQASPVLDVLAETPEQQQQALAQGVLPEVRASVAEGGWLLVAGAGLVLAFAGIVARLSFGRRPPEQALPGSELEPEVNLEPAPISASTPLSPLTEAEVQRRVAGLQAAARGEAEFTVLPRAKPAAVIVVPEPVMN